MNIIYYFAKCFDAHLSSLKLCYSISNFVNILRCTLKKFKIILRIYKKNLIYTKLKELIKSSMHLTKRSNIYIYLYINFLK